MKLQEFIENSIDFNKLATVEKPDYIDEFSNDFWDLSIKELPILPKAINNYSSKSKSVDFTKKINAKIDELSRLNERIKDNYVKLFIDYSTYKK